MEKEDALSYILGDNEEEENLFDAEVTGFSGVDSWCAPESDSGSQDASQEQEEDDKEEMEVEFENTPVEIGDQVSPRSVSSSPSAAQFLPEHPHSSLSAVAE